MPWKKRLTLQDKPWLLDVGIAAILLLLTLTFFRKLIGNNQTFFGADMFYFYPLRGYLSGEIKNGILPLWNPYVFSGSPAASHSSFFGLFYPLNILFLILPLNAAFNWMVIIHVFLAGLFMYSLARTLGINLFGSLISGIIYIFSGSFIAAISTGMIDVFTSIVWVPLIFLFFEKAIRKNSLIYAIFAGIAMGLQGLGGHPQILMYTSYAVFFYLLFRIAGLLSFKKERLKSIGRITLLFVFIFVIGYGLYAVQLIPGLEIFFSNVSARSGGTGYSFASSYSLPPRHLVTFLFPDFFGNPITGQYWGELNFDELCMYIGVLPLLLALFAVLFVRNKYVKIYFGLAILSLLIAFGQYGPLHRIFYHILPGFNVFRCPARWLYFSTFSFSILAGFGSSLLTNKGRYKKGLTLLAKIIFSIALLLSMLIIFERFTEKSLLTFWIKAFATSSWGKEVPLQTRYSGALKSLYTAVLLLTISGTLILLRLKERIKSGIFKGLMITFILCDLWIFGGKFIIPVNDELYLASEQWEFFKGDKDFYRVMTRFPVEDYGATANKIFVFGGETESLELKDYVEFRNRTRNYDRILNAKYLLTTEEIDDDRYEYLTSKTMKLSEPFDLKEIKIYDAPVKIYRYNDFIPRAFIVHRAEVIGNKDRIFEKLNSELFNPKELVILEEEPKFKLNTVSTILNEDRVTITNYSSNKIELKTYLKNAGFLVLSEVYFPGWKVFVDGEEDKIFKANYILRAVYLKKGKHKVEFLYDPFSFRVGKYISLFTLGLIVLFIAGKGGFYRFRRRVKRDETE